MNPCVECGESDADTDAGWSLCAECFHADQFDGRAHWKPLWSLLLWLLALALLVAVLTVLAA